jgi:Anti-sigma factor NepR
MARKAQRRSGWLDPCPSEVPTKARIGPDLQDRLGLQLRAMYDQVRSEPLPERILDLLTRLDQTDTTLDTRRV